MNRENYARIYRVKLALDLLNGLEAPSTQIALRMRDGSEGRLQEHMYAREARLALGAELLRASGLDEADFFNLSTLSDDQLLARIDRPSAREEAARLESQQREERRQQRAAATREERIRNRTTMRGAPHPGRAIRPSSSVLEAIRELARPAARYGGPIEVDARASEAPDEAEIPAVPGRPFTPERMLDWTLRAPGTTPQASATEVDDSPWATATDEPAVGYALDIHGNPAGSAVDPNTGEIVWPVITRGKKTKSGKMRKAPQEVPKPKPAGKPARRLVIGRKRPPLEPDD